MTKINDPELWQSYREKLEEFTLNAATPQEVRNWLIDHNNPWLQLQKRLVRIVAVAVLADVRGLEQTDRVIMVQRARGDARQPGKLFDSEHALTINPYGTLMSRVF